MIPSWSNIHVFYQQTAPTAPAPIWYQSSGVTFKNLKHGNFLYTPESKKLEHQKQGAMTNPRGDEFQLKTCSSSTLYKPTPECFTIEHYGPRTGGGNRQEFLVVEKKVDSGNLVTMIPEGDFPVLKIYGTIQDNTYKFAISGCGDAQVGPNAICGMIVVQTDFGERAIAGGTDGSTVQYVHIPGGYPSELIWIMDTAATPAPSSAPSASPSQSPSASPSQAPTSTPKPADIPSFYTAPGGVAITNAGTGNRLTVAQDAAGADILTELSPTSTFNGKFVMSECVDQTNFDCFEFLWTVQYNKFPWGKDYWLYNSPGSTSITLNQEWELNDSTTMERLPGILMKIQVVPCPASTATIPASSICGQILDSGTGTKAWIGGQPGVALQSTTIVDAKDSNQIWVIEPQVAAGVRRLRGRRNA